MLKLLKKIIKSWTLSVVIYSVLGFLVHLFVIRHIILFVDEFTSVSKSVFDVLQTPYDLLYLFNDTKYILLWTDYALINDLILSQINCPLKNCIVTKNRGLLGGDYTKFDAILFHEYGILTNSDDRPTRKRNASQLYIFTSIESPVKCPACEIYNDNFFNWTFTNRLDSDVPWHHFIVRDYHGSFVAPSANVQWKMSMKYPLNARIKEIVHGRSRAAAWIDSHCEAQSLRDKYLTRLQSHLSYYGLQIDVFGKCSQSCGGYQECENYVRKHYYFYMAFENSFADDYVTEKVLHGYDNYVVPIVFGGANYTRFLPPGSYINALNYHPYNLARLMNELIKSPRRYEKYLQWTNFYYFQSKPSEYHPLCDLCVALNREEAKHAPAIKNFRIWWNTLNGMKRCLSEDNWNETSFNTPKIDGSHNLMYRYSNFY